MRKNHGLKVSLPYYPKAIKNIRFPYLPEIKPHKVIKTYIQAQN